MPDNFALPPVEHCFGTRPIQAANSLPLWKAAPLPIEATIAVATNGPMSGICLSRWHAATLESTSSTSWLRSTLSVPQGSPKRGLHTYEKQDGTKSPEAPFQKVWDMPPPRDRRVALVDSARSLVLISTF